MTSTESHTHGSEGAPTGEFPAAPPFPGFRPSGQYAVDAQQEQLRRLRIERDVVDDRAAFYAACLAQLQAESQEAIGNLAAELSTTRNDLLLAQAKLTKLGEYLASKDPNFEGIDKLLDEAPAVVPEARASTNGHPLGIPDSHTQQSG